MLKLLLVCVIVGLSTAQNVNIFFSPTPNVQVTAGWLSSTANYIVNCTGTAWCALGWNANTGTMTGLEVAICANNGSGSLAVNLYEATGHSTPTIATHQFLTTASCTQSNGFTLMIFSRPFAPTNPNTNTATLSHTTPTFHLAAVGTSNTLNTVPHLTTNSGSYQTALTVATPTTSPINVPKAAIGSNTSTFILVAILAIVNMVRLF